MSRLLYKLDGSPPARAAMMVVDLLGLDIELRDLDLLNGAHLKPDFLKINPQHTVPTLVDGDFSIWDSHAIAAYLVGAYADDDNLYPKDLKRRALVDQRLHFDSGILFPAIVMSIRQVIWNGAKELNPLGLERTSAGYGLLETFLEGQTWITGDTMTVADICAVSSISSMNEYLPVDPEKYPNIVRWLDQFEELDFFKKMNKPGCKNFGELVRSRIS